MKRVALALLLCGLTSLVAQPAVAWHHYQVCPNMGWPCYGCRGPALARGYGPGYYGHGSWGYWPGYQIGAYQPCCRHNGFANFRYVGVGPAARGYGYGFGSTPPGFGWGELYW
jgi:hypothetical protein